MRTGYAVSRTARCPFYCSEQREHETKLRCEGLRPGTWIHYVFSIKSEMIHHREMYCKGCYEKCPLYIAHILAE